MTDREMFVAIRNKVAEDADMVAFIDRKLAAMDARNAKATVKRSDAMAERCKVVLAALQFINEEVTVTELIENAPNEVRGWTRQKVTPILTELEKQGKVARTEFKRVPYYKVVS